MHQQKAPLELAQGMILMFISLPFPRVLHRDGFFLALPDLRVQS